MTFFLAFPGKPLHESASYEQGDEKRSTVSAHRNDKCKLKNMSTKHNRYVGHQELNHFDDVSFRELFVISFRFIHNIIFVHS
jgi:hypothetical protein